MRDSHESYRTTRTRMAVKKVEGVQGAWWMPEGVKGRRRTWLAAKSGGELLASVEPPMSEWGNPTRVMPGDSVEKAGEASPGTETSQYREEQTSTEIPQVVASERGGAQTDCYVIAVMRCNSGVDSRTGREVTLRDGREKPQTDSSEPGTAGQRR